MRVKVSIKEYLIKTYWLLLHTNTFLCDVLLTVLFHEILLSLCVMKAVKADMVCKLLMLVL